jgi:hypothetical protein
LLNPLPLNLLHFIKIFSIILMVGRYLSYPLCYLISWNLKIISDSSRKEQI